VTIDEGSAVGARSLVVTKAWRLGLSTAAFRRIGSRDRALFAREAELMAVGWAQRVG
jgi:hypothetical protein